MVNPVTALSTATLQALPTTDKCVTSQTSKTSEGAVIMGATITLILGADSKRVASFSSIMEASMQHQEAAEVGMGVEAGAGVDAGVEAVAVVMTTTTSPAT